MKAAHYWLAYCEKFQRDRERLADCRKRVNICPLGSAALAGTSLPIDRSMTAELLEFEHIAANSLDVSSDRDYLAEFVFCMSLIAAHLSTWCEEWIIWFTTEFSFIKLPDAYTTGSSIMPQKRNPDAAELARAKTGRIIGALNALLIVMKGLPLAYSKDSQWRNRDEFLTGRDDIRAFLTGKWAREREYRLIKGLWTFEGARIAVRFAYEWHDAGGQWFRSYGNENWEFAPDGLMRRRIASINDMAIDAVDRLMHWPLGPRPANHPGLEALGL